METASVIRRFEEFIAEAEKDCDAWSALGKDDNSYDAGRWRDEATSIKEALERQDFGSVQEALDDSFIEAESHEEWLEKATQLLHGLC